MHENEATKVQKKKKWEKNGKLSERLSISMFRWQRGKTQFVFQVVCFVILFDNKLSLRSDEVRRFSIIENRNGTDEKKKRCLFNNKVSHYQDVCNACNRKDTEKEKHEDGDGGGGSSGSGDKSQPTCNQYQPAHVAHILSTKMGN